MGVGLVVVCVVECESLKMGSTGVAQVVGTVVELVGWVVDCGCGMCVGQVGVEVSCVDFFRGFDDARLKCNVGPCDVDGLGRSGASSGAAGMVAT